MWAQQMPHLHSWAGHFMLGTVVASHKDGKFRTVTGNQNGETLLEAKKAHFAANT